jgi:hypothetical protein
MVGIPLFAGHAKPVRTARAEQMHVSLTARADRGIPPYFEPVPGVNTPLLEIVVRPTVQICLWKLFSSSWLWCYYSVAAASSIADADADAADSR